MMDELPFPYHPIRHPARFTLGRPIQMGREAVEQLQLRQINVKEAFTLQDPSGQFFRASLTACGPKGAEALVYEAMARSPESPLGLTLISAVLARQRMLLVMQKATELGATRIQPVFTERSVQAEGLAHEKAHAWPGATVRAARQCRRASLPVVLPTVPLAEALAGTLWTGAASRFYLDDLAPEGTRLLRGAADAVLAVGPEGGWTDAERALLAESDGHVLVLGGRILRAETAVLTGLVLLQHRLGDLSTAPGAVPPGGSPEPRPTAPRPRPARGPSKV
jgi:16S rRNA (uracil1498-N3)-methyltransferase